MSSFAYLLLLSFSQKSAMAFMLSLGDPARAAGAALYGSLADALPVLLLLLAAWRANPAWAGRAVAAYTSALSVLLARRPAVPARPRLAAASLALAAAVMAGLSLVPPLPEGESSLGFVNFSRNRGLGLVKVPSLASFYGAFAAPRRPVIEGERPEYTPEELAAL